MPPGDTFAGMGKPGEPDNVSIPAAGSAISFAFVGDYGDRFPDEDLDLARENPYFMADISGLRHGGLNIALGVGDATAMRGSFVAGFDAGLKLVRSRYDTVAAVWRCVPNELVKRRACKRSTLGPGIAYGIDSHGEAVGDDEPSAPDVGALELHSPGFPVLWRLGDTIPFSEGIRGAAYAISESGVIVGTFSAGPTRNALLSGFVASAGDRKPRAQALDDLVRNIGGRHIEAGLGVADDGRILAFVTEKDQKRELAVLLPVAP